MIVVAELDKGNSERGVSQVSVSQAAAENGQARVPPYISFRTLRTFIEDLRANRIPPRIDRGAVRHRFSGSVGTQLMSALRFLRLTDENGTPQPALRELVAATTADQWKEKLRGVLQAAYEPLMALDFGSIPPEHLAQAFREHYTGQEQVLRKSQSFFLQALQDAGTELGPRLQRGTRRATRPRTGTARGKKNGEPETTRPSGTPPDDKKPPIGEPIAVVADYLPLIFNPQTMDDDVREAWYKLFTWIKQQAVSRK